jgi:hypothetical protein
MAKKKTKEPTTIDYQIDVSKLSLTQEKYINQIGQFVEENIPSSSARKDGNILDITVPVAITKRMLRLRVNKFLYQSGLKAQYRLVSLVTNEATGYQIIER